MAKLDLLPRKEFVITLDSGEIKGKYSLWAIKRFCDKKGLSLMELQQRLTAEKSTMDDVIQTILCAVEHSQREAGKPFSYSDFDVCNWIEELGGIQSENFLKLQAHAYVEEGDEKKSPIDQSPGETSNESVTQPV